MRAKSLQSCCTLCNPMDGSPPGSSVHGILQAIIWSELPYAPPGERTGDEGQDRLGVRLRWSADPLSSAVCGDHATVPCFCSKAPQKWHWFVGFLYLFVYNLLQLCQGVVTLSPFSCFVSVAPGDLCSGASTLVKGPRSQPVSKAESLGTVWSLPRSPYWQTSSALKGYNPNKGQIAISRFERNAST